MPARGVNGGVAFELVTFNDDGGVLHVTTYAATAAHRGEPTSFRVRKLRSPAAVTMRCNGEQFDRWRSIGPDEIEIDTTIDRNSFEILAGNGTESKAEGADASRSRAIAPTKLDLPRESGASAIRDAGLLIVSGGGTCPCCA